MALDYTIDAKFDDAQKCWVVAITGEVDIFNAQDMKKSLTELINDKNTDVVIDCKLLDYIDSTALGALVGVLKNVRSYGGTMYLRGVKPSLAKLFRITKLDKVFEIEGETGE
jgi:anti-sigma B factor antagonist